MIRTKRNKKGARLGQFINPNVVFDDKPKIKVTRLDDFVKLSARNFVTKLAQMLWLVVGHF